MINAVIDGICGKLIETFGEGYKVYTEGVEQGLQEPCFFVVSLKSAFDQFMARKYHVKNHFVIYFYNKKGPEAMEDSVKVMEQLTDALEYITIDGQPVRGTQMSGEVENGLLLFYVNYDFFVYRTAEETAPMETLDLKQKGW